MNDSAAPHESVPSSLALAVHSDCYSVAYVSKVIDCSTYSEKDCNESGEHEENLDRVCPYDGFNATLYDG